MSLHKKKRPPREDKPIKERIKITAYALDDFTAMILVGFINNSLIKSVDYPISSGKEAVVFRATTPGGHYYAIKVFKYETSSFKHMDKYIEGDPRFLVVKRQKRPLVREWSSKEYSNLRKAYEAGVPCPRPIKLKDNVILMEFIGVDGVPYALMQDVIIQEPSKVFEKIMESVRKLYAEGLVHGDLSPYNIIIAREKGKEHPVIIDWGQAVLKEHPRAHEFLEKDVNNVCHYFKRQGLDCNAQDELKKIIESSKKKS